MTKGKTNLFSILLTRLFTVFRFFCGSVVVVMMGLVVVGVGLRTFRIGFIPGNEEFIEFFVAMSIYLGVAPLQQEKGHIRVRLLVDYLPRKLQALADVVAWLFFLVFFALILWQGWEAAVVAWSRGERFHAITLPVYPFRFGLVLGAMFMVIQLLIDLKSSLQALVWGKEGKVS